MMLYTPTTIYLSSGCGVAKAEHELLAFDRALKAAGMADFNLMRVSSIVPPRCKIIQQAPLRNPGRLAPTVYSKISTINQEHASVLISACIALATCKDHNQNGVVFEVAMKDAGKQVTENLAVEMAKLAMEDRGLDIEDLFVESAEIYVKQGEAGCVVITAMMD